ncbi:hypothetical protein [Syntrophus aciditrophicus]|uniref:hypothetical protein n=1 Tax=Syntrophus aciditrophicus TaxID=316277 RepID=UPI00059F5703|nr:hypothetical protein [Syntrophus aciditrophicus]
MQTIINTTNAKVSNAPGAFITQKEYSFPIFCLKLGTSTIPNQAIISTQAMTFAIKFHRDAWLLIFMPLTIVSSVKKEAVCFCISSFVVRYTDYIE